MAEEELPDEAEFVPADEEASEDSEEQDTTNEDEVVDSELSEN